MRAIIMLLAALAMPVSTSAANGDLDTSFGVQGVARAGVSNVAIGQRGAVQTIQPIVQPDGKILTCASLSNGGSTGNDMLVSRFTADGVLDTSFSFDGKVVIDFDGATGGTMGGDTCTGLALQSDGKIVVVGYTKSSTTNGFDFALARLLSDGTLDTSFASGTGKEIIGFDLGGSNDDYASAVLIQSDGKIVVTGNATVGGGAINFAILRLNSDGARDPAFNITGRVTVSFNLATSPKVDHDLAYAAALDASGNILVAGQADKGSTGLDNDFAVARLLPDGQPDSNFNANGRATVAFDLGGSTGSNSDQGVALLLQHDGRIVIGGYTDSSTTATANSDMAVARLMPDGSLDSSFGIGGKTSVVFDLVPNGQDTVLALAEQTNHKLLLGGTAFASTDTSNIKAAAVRLNRDGSPDATFGISGKKLFDFGLHTPAQQLFNGLNFQGEQIIVDSFIQVAASSTAPATTGLDSALVRLQNDLIFANGFD